MACRKKTHSLSCAEKEALFSHVKSSFYLCVNSFSNQFLGWTFCGIDFSLVFKRNEISCIIGDAVTFFYSLVDRCIDDTVVASSPVSNSFDGSNANDDEGASNETRWGPFYYNSLFLFTLPCKTFVFDFSVGVWITIVSRYIQQHVYIPDELLIEISPVLSNASGNMSIYGE